jgi:hypothetical protein
LAEKNKQIFFKWLKLNVLWFMGAFVVALLLVLLFPATMLGLRLWGAYTIAVGLLSFRNFWCEFGAWFEILGALR